MRRSSKSSIRIEPLIAKKPNFAINKFYNCANAINGNTDHTTVCPKRITGIVSYLFDRDDLDGLPEEVMGRIRDGRYDYRSHI